MRRLVPPLLSFAVAFALSACGSSKDAPMPRGDWRPLAAAQWDIDPVQVVVPLMPEAKR